MICYYVLTHVESGVFYIGCTSNFIRRYRTHINRLKACSHHAKLLQEVYNLRPRLTFETFEVATIEEARLKEKEFIALNKDNPHLANTYGTGNYVISEAQLNANRSRRGMPLSDSAKAKISTINKGKTRSVETKARLSELKMGKCRPEGFIDRLAVINSVPVRIEGDVYSSQKEVAIKYGISPSGVRQRLKSNTIRWREWVYV